MCNDRNFKRKNYFLIIYINQIKYLNSLDKRLIVN